MGCLIIELDWWVITLEGQEKTAHRANAGRTSVESNDLTQQIFWTIDELWESFTHYIFTILSGCSCCPASGTMALEGSPTHLWLSAYENFSVVMAIQSWGSIWWPQISKNQLIPMTNVIRDKIVKNAFHDLCTFFFCGDRFCLDAVGECGSKCHGWFFLTLETGGLCYTCKEVSKGLIT